MKEYTKNDLDKIYKGRRDKLVQYLQDNNLGAVIFQDSEEHRDASLRYYTGHPSDALFIVFSSGKNYLVPWDEILCKKVGHADSVIPYTKFKNSDITCIQTILNKEKNIPNKKVDVSPQTSYIKFLKIIDALPEWDVKCREYGTHEFVRSCRLIKDQYEIDCTREACRVGDLIIEEIERQLKASTIKTETDVALLIEKLLRENDCEKTGFDTLAAGPNRSWAIHAFPGYTGEQWPGDGLSILDFGVIYKGYTSDTTLTVVKNPNAQQEKLVSLVEAAAKECLPLYKANTPVNKAAELCNTIFDKAQRKMPHTLGHAIGLEIHEYPRVSTKMTDDVVFKPGMIITLEPGLYDEALGGVRLENDVLITEEGNEVITHSKIIRL